MELSIAIELARQALVLATQLGLPILLALLVISFLVGLFQTMTQVQEQTLSVVVKLIAGAVILVWLLPWMTGRIVEYTRALFERIPENIGMLM